MYTYKVSFEGFKEVEVEACTKKEAIKVAKENLICWGFYPAGKAQVRK